ncbi:DMT family transporter [Vibrio methylphosphonaticus]|uniref:DMT family transporter n=1 Tax=Vibrio methylphosphonaticus TaxID=2946866 RepID=UPI002029E7C2|nr:DMT family transporter [Vibrio methylphosphonaticus]MCL9774918.1 DMT family transporter [Vibrio methylphosphonaticus]
MPINRHYASYLPSNTAILGLLLVSVMWGTSYGVSKKLLDLMSLEQLLFARFAISSLVLGVILIRKNAVADFLALPRRYLAVGTTTGVILTGIFITETWAVMLTQASEVAVLISLCVLFTPFVERIWLKATLPVSIYLYCFIGVVGIALASNTDWNAIILNDSVMLILTAAILRSIMVVVCRKALSDEALSLELVTFIQLSVVTLSMFGLIIVQSDASQTMQMLALFGVEQVLYLLYLALACTLLAFFIQNYSVRFLSASHASLLMATEPLFGLLFSVFFLNEVLSLLQWGGSTLIVSTTMAACYQFSKQKTSQN